MVSREDIVNSLLDADARAAQAAERVRSGLSQSGSKAAILPYVVDYIFAKYRIDLAEGDGMTLEQLAELSLSKALAIDPDLALRANAASTCDGASTTDMKQALLLMAMQKDFGVTLDGIKLAYAETVEDLTALVLRSANRRGDGS